MCISDRVADVQKPAQQLLQFEDAGTGICTGIRVFVEPGDRVPEAVSFDEPHGVIGTPLTINAQTIDRYDTGVFQPAGNLGFEQKACPALWLVGMLDANLLVRNLAVQLDVLGDEDLAQPASIVKPQNPKSRA